MQQAQRCWSLTVACLILLSPPGWCSDTAPLQLALDATELPRKLLQSTVMIRVGEEVTRSGGEVKLRYPRWVPGAHAPGGPIANLAGLIIEDDRQQRLEWQRSSTDVFLISVQVPAGSRHLHVRLRYITNQPTTQSMGIDSFGSALVGVISPNTVLLYPADVDIDEASIAVSLTLPSGWTAATALRTVADDSPRSEYAPVLLRTLVDSPIMCGRFRRTYDLVEPAERASIPPHRLHVFSDAESVLEIDEELLQRLRRMVTQTSLLFGSHPFPEFDLLLATTDQLPANGLEHSRSSLNVLSQRVLQSPKNLRGWNRLLIPHEYLHAWCGKYRLPAGMLKSDFHSPLEMDLLWVYEGLTQYLGELIEARCGLMTSDEFLARLTLEVRHALLQQGRNWRSLADTGIASHQLRDGSRSWGRLRRSQDYYMEGMLFWLEVDAIIRKRTDGRRSLDDFCREFFAAPSATARPRDFTREDIVAALNQVAPYDWSGLISRRIELVTERFQPAVVERLGYAIQYANVAPSIPHDTYRYVTGLDAYDSLGGVFGADGTVRDVLLGSPADRAGLGPGMKIMGVNGHVWSSNRMQDAIAMSATRGHVECLIVRGDSFDTRRIDYGGGPRYLTLVPIPDQPQLLPEILRPLQSRPK